MTLVSITPPPVNLREALRYAGCRESEPNLPLAQCAQQMEEAARGQVLFEEVSVRETPVGVDLSFAAPPSLGLKKNLDGCRRAILFAATIGLEADRLIAKYARISPVHSLLLHGLGAERIEAVCNEFCRQKNLDLNLQGLCLTPRFSPGYGDLPLSFQRDIFSFLECEKHLGLTLTPTLLMVPTKSVTAVAGIRQKGAPRAQSGCAACSRADCSFRRDG